MDEKEDLNELQDAGTSATASIEELLGGQEEKWVVVKTLGKRVKIKKIKSGDLADISKVSKGDNIEMAMGLVFKGLVEPKMEYGQVRALDSLVMLEVALAVSDHSGLGKEAVDRARNLFTQEEGMPSGS